MANNQHRLIFKDAKIGYSAKVLVEPFNLELNKGELIALTGLNGAGKTSLFKTILKEIPLLGGECLINNNPLDEVETYDWISVVYTDKLDTLGLTVRDVLESGKWRAANWRGKISSKANNTINNYVKLLSIEHIEYQPLKTLSDGQFQKVMIAKALIQETPIILLDEPTAFLDVKNKKEIFNLLRDIAEKEGKTIIVSTHDMEFCKQYCNRVLMIKNKKLQEINSENLEYELLND